MKKLTLILLWIVVAAHAGFAVIEMFPWGRPWVFDQVHLGFNPLANEWTAAPIVHNAGLYNVFLAAGLVSYANHTVDSNCPRRPGISGGLA